MLSAARVSFIVIFSLLATASVLAKATSDLLDKQEEILRQLAEEGVEEANHVLGRFYEANLKHFPDFLTKAQAYYQKSARLGNSKSLYWLGHHLLRQKRLEGLTLLCESAILGERRAQVDLVMIPRFYGDLSTKDIAQQCTIARQRLKTGYPVDCIVGNCANKSEQNTLPPCPQCAEKAARFELAWKESSASSFDNFFLQNIQGFSLISPEQIRRYRQAIYADNRRIDFLNRLKAAKHPTEAQQAQQQIKRQLVKEDLNKDLAHLKPKIQHLLDIINQHRTPQSRLTLEQVIEELKKQLAP
ncbi:MAG: hypothetical protein AXA67_05615 [Methylothermaceae bacteria B42]|nr:MAG: hypothetical protein AXA67_05615 [Methylothermaceae bacteria B42]HHJ40330.1 hypothetical protein [Methylothermaceae bacterium]